MNQVIQNMKIRKELKDRLEANREEKKIIFYTDGSLSRESTRDKVVMGYSVVQVDSTNNEVFRYKGRIENWFSSTRAELVACLVAVLVVPNECIVEIRIDSDAVIYAITNCLRNEKTCDWLKTKNNNILQAIKKVCRSKLVQLRFTKIKSYSGDIYNDLADTLAKEGSYEAHSTALNNISSSSIKYITEWKNLNLETPLRAFVKKIVQTIYKAD